MIKSRKLQSFFRSFSEKQHRSAFIAARYLVNSTISKSIEERFVDLFIGLEAIYLGADSGELSWRLAQRCALHVGLSPEERRKIVDVIRDGYKLRSKIVHGVIIIGDFNSNQRVFENFPIIFELLRMSIFGRILKYPHLNDLRFKEYIDEIALD